MIFKHKIEVRMVKLGNIKRIKGVIPAIITPFE